MERKGILSKFWIGILLCMGLMPACGDNHREYIEFIEIGNGGLGRNIPYCFHLPDSLYALSNDSTDIYLEIRYTENYSLKNLILDVEVAGSKKDTIETHRYDMSLFSDMDMANERKGLSILSKTLPIYSTSIDNIPIEITISTPMEDTNGIISLGIISATLSQ